MSEYIVNLDGKLGIALAVACAGAGFAREEIVRCRDCECFDDETSLCNRLGKFPEWHACTEPDGFCKWGERKDRS